MEIGALDGRKASEKLIARCTLDRFSGGGEGGDVFRIFVIFFPPRYDISVAKTEMMTEGKSYPARYNFLFRHPRSTSCRIFRFERIPPVFYGLFFIFSRNDSNIFPPSSTTLFLVISVSRIFSSPGRFEERAGGVKRRTRN